MLNEKCDNGRTCTGVGSVSTFPPPSVLMTRPRASTADRAAPMTTTTRLAVVGILRRRVVTAGHREVTRTAVAVAVTEAEVTAEADEEEVTTTRTAAGRTAPLSPAEAKMTATATRAAVALRATTTMTTAAAARGAAVVGTTRGRPRRRGGRVRLRVRGVARPLGGLVVTMPTRTASMGGAVGVAVRREDVCRLRRGTAV